MKKSVFSSGFMVANSLLACMSLKGWFVGSWVFVWLSQSSM